jgi:hypothetical protein
VDARTITTTRAIDALDRVTLVHYSLGLTPDTTYTYDSPCTFGKGRLCSISNGPVVSYVYNRFGQVTQDGRSDTSTTPTATGRRSHTRAA